MLAPSAVDRVLSLATANPGGHSSVPRADNAVAYKANFNGFVVGATFTVAIVERHLKHGEVVEARSPFPWTMLLVRVCR